MADLSFLITINLINAPATKIPKRLLIYQTSGRMTTSITAISKARIVEIAMIRGVLFRNIDVISIK
jgi:hypothetical protein